MNRRHFLALGTAVTGATSHPAHLLGALAPQAASRDARPVFGRYADLLKLLKQRGHKPRVLGLAPDGSPVVAVKAGGEKSPAIFIGAGSHATEHAGVAAAVELIDQLDTEHQVYVLPCRDPVGLSGFRHALSLALGEPPEIDSLKDAEQLMRKRGEVLYDRDGRLLVLIGEYGYANAGFYRKVEKGAPFLEALKGRRLFWPSNYQDVPGSGPLQRAYTQVVTPDGEVLHLNRFHDTAWAPVEVRCTRRLMAEIQPRLTFDLHEYTGGDFWMSARRQKTDEDEAWERRMSDNAAQAALAAGATFPGKQYRPGSFFEKLQPGVFWLDPQQRGEGLNLADFAAHTYGPSFTIETGMRQSFTKRVELHIAAVQAAVRVFEQRYGA